MKNCLIMGSGRSGTSMVAGTLAHAGYFMGEDLYDARDTNPKGFFEAHQINRLNEVILAHVTASRPKFLGKWGRILFPKRAEYGQRWLCRIPVSTAWPELEKVNRDIPGLTGHRPFCFKDPRFCYTLDYWRPHCPDTVFICVFRSPVITARSIVKEAKTAEYLKGFSIDTEEALELWRLLYQHVLDNHYPKGGDWLFLHYEQVLNGDALPLLEAKLGARTDPSFATPDLKRTEADEPIPDKLQELYRRLCELAGYNEITI